MYDMQSNEEKQDHHAVAAKIYGLDARKCNSCGNGHFLRVPSKDKFPEVKCEYCILEKYVSLIICKLKSVESFLQN